MRFGILHLNLYCKTENGEGAFPILSMGDRNSRSRKYLNGSIPPGYRKGQ